MKLYGCCRRAEMYLEEDFSKVYEVEMQELKELWIFLCDEIALSGK